MTNLSKGKFSSIKLLLPPGKLRKSYHEITEPIFDQLKNLTIKNFSLKKSRDLLLPRLISGKLPVENLDIHFPPGMEEAVHEG